MVYLIYWAFRGFIHLKNVWERGLFYEAKILESFLYKELERLVETFRLMKLEVIKPKIKIKSELPAGEKIILDDQSTWSVIVVVN